MVVCGVFLKANEVRIITLSGTRGQHKLTDTKVNKLAIVKHPTRKEVQDFIIEFKAYCEQHQIDKLMLNRRATTGQGAGGAGTFILEGALLATSELEIEFIHPATLRATDKKEADLKTAQPKTQDLAKAYDLAFQGLS